MTNNQIELARQDGCITDADLNIWYLGYLRGERDCLDCVMEDMNEIVHDDIYDSIKEEFKRKEND